MKLIFSKILILFLFVLICNYSYAIEKMYYCIEKETIAFDPKENFKAKKYEPFRFKAKIDINNNAFSSDDIRMTTTSCERMIVTWKHLMQCKTSFGGFFVLNTKNLKFSYTHMIGMHGDDPVVLAHGRCEEF
mgnify:CR=1 FL=1